MHLKQIKLLIAVLAVAAASTAHAATTWSKQDYDLYPGDFDGDGKTDLLYVAKDPAKTSGIALSDGTGPSIDGQSWPGNYLGIPWHSNLYVPVVADFNGDHRDDILLQRSTPGDSYLLLAKPNFRGIFAGIEFTIASNYGGVLWSADQHKILAADFSGDGRADLFFQSTTPAGQNAILLADWSTSSGIPVPGPQQSWSNNYLGFKWSTQDANVVAGDFNGDAKADLLVQAKPKTVLIDFEIPIPVPVFAPNSFGLVYSEGAPYYINSGVKHYYWAAGSELFKSEGVRQWSRNSFGVDWSPSLHNLVVGNFDNSGGADLLFQSRSAGRSSFVLASNTAGIAFASASALASSVAWSGDGQRLLAGNFTGTGVGVFFQATSPAGVNSLTTSVYGANVAATVHNTDSVTGLFPASDPGLTAGSVGVTHRGEATFSIPIELPAGINGLKPTLAITYNSSAGSGYLGPHWDIGGYSSISRCARTVAQNGETALANNQATDRYCLNGNQLRLVSGNYGAAGSRYRTELETYSRITALGASNQGPLSFQVEGKDGLIYQYGSTAGSRVIANGGNGSGICVSNACTIRTWLVDKITDRAGNYILFAYSSQSVGAAPLPSTITYTGTASTLPQYTVQFDYGTRVTDPLHIDNTIVDQVYSSKLIHRLRVSYAGSQVREYKFGYLWDGKGAPNQPLLKSVQECARSNSECREPMFLEWTEGVRGWRSIEGGQATIGADPNLFRSLDFNGDGFSDIAFYDSSSSHWKFIAGSLNGYTAAVDSGYGNVASSAANNTAYAKHAVVFDYDSNGSDDLLVAVPGSSATSTSWSWLRHNPGGTFAFASIGVSNPMALLAGPAAAVLDVNGDGQLDLLVSDGSSLWVNRHVASGTGFAAATYAGAPPNGAALRSILSGSKDSKHRNIDLTGDGKHELILQDAAGFRVARSTGTSFAQFPAFHYWPEVAEDYPEPASQASSRPIVPIDFNGDRCDDFGVGTEYMLFRRSVCNVSDYYTENVGDGENGPHPNWSAGVEVGSAPLVAAVDTDSDSQEEFVYRYPGDPNNAAAWMEADSDQESDDGPVSLGFPSNGTLFASDIDGDGLDDLTHVDTSGVVRYHRRAGQKPELLVKVTDSYGSTTVLNYQPSSAGHCVHNDGSSPAATTGLKRSSEVRHVVCSVTSSDGTGGAYTRSYGYHNANVSTDGRGDVGFERRTTTDSRTNAVRDEGYFQAFPYIGMVSSLIDKQNNGTKIQEVTITPAKVVNGSGYETTHFPYISSSIVDAYEVGGARNGTLISRQTTTVNAIDSYGNLTDVTTSLQDKDSLLTPLDQNYRTRVVQSIANDTDHWCLGRSHNTQTKAILADNSEQVRTTARTIDYAACRVTDEVTEPGTPSLSVSVHYDYDVEACGQVSDVRIVGRRSDGTALPARTTQYGFGASCRFPETITDPLGKVTTRTYDYAQGLLLSETDPNGDYTGWEHDGFGRRIKETRADGTSTTIAFSACNKNNGYCGVSDLRLRVDTTSRDTAGNSIRGSVDYLDGFGRLRIEDEPLPVSGSMSHVVSTYDSFGRLASRTVPYSLASQGRTTYSYDLRGRQTAAVLQDAAGVTVRQTSVRHEGRRSVFIDPRGKETERYFDVIGQVRKTKDPDAGANVYTQYAYTFISGDLQTTVTDAAGNASITTTNRLGHRVKTQDADMGVWTAEYSSLGEFTKQTDAKGQIVRFDDYDQLGRPTVRHESEADTTWTYGTVAQNAYGRLKSVSSSGYSETYDYDSIGRTLAMHITVPGEPAVYDVDYEYDGSSGLLDTVTYPISTTGARFKIKYGYSQGAQTSVRDYTGNVSGTQLWQLMATDAMGHATEESLGNGARVISGFDPVTGLISARKAGTDSGAANRQNLSYIWDANGNLEQRTDHNQSGLQERFYYDSLNRLDYSTRSQAGTTITNLDLGYSAIGNIETKSEPGIYTYAYDYAGAQSDCSYPFTHAQPHAVRRVNSTSYCYDANGNMSKRGSATLTWNSDNTLRKITDGSLSSEFWYTPDGDRYKQHAVFAAGSETTIYIGGMLEKVTPSSGQVAYRHYISAGTSTVIHTRWSGGAAQTYYVAADHLGSSSTIMDQAGTTVVSESFDAFGKRRGTNWTGTPTTAQMQVVANVTRMGYTGQEHLDNLGLIHMNGRVQDPALGRFISADPYIQAPGFSQSLNRYSYVWNNPLSMTDPSGFDAVVCDGERCTTVEGPVVEATRLCDFGWTCVSGDDVRHFLGFFADAQSWRDMGDNTVDEFLINPYNNGVQTFEDAKNGELLGATVGIAGIACDIGKVCRGVERFAEKILRIDLGKALRKIGGCCFVAGTLVAADVGARPIETIRIGDYVLARDESTGTDEYKPVIDIYVNDQHSLWELTVSDAEGRADVHRVTANHPYWIEGKGWVEADDLAIGEKLTTEHGATATLTAIRDTGVFERTYNLEVADFHTFFVGPQRVLVHNGKKCKLDTDSSAPRGKAPDQVTPGTRNVKGEYDPSDRAQPEPYSAHYDQYGRQIGRTDYTNQPDPNTHTDPHHHTREYGPHTGAKGQERGPFPGLHPLDEEKLR